ncbi:MAG: hypothetical protein Kow0077_10360 [Anaerolineae bacterium]
MWPRLTTQRLTAALLFILLFAMAARTPVDTDIWWHLRNGEYQLEHRTVVGEDLFSHTRQGAPWTNHSWGAQVVLALVYQVGGDVGLTLLMALLATGGLAFVYAASEGSVYIRAFALVLAGATAAVFWSPRPQMFTFLFSGVVYYLLMRFKWLGDARALWAIPPVVALWGNLHAGFATAFILILGVIAGEVVALLFGPRTEHVIGWRGVGRLALIGVVSVAALLLNPFGAEILKVPFATVNIGVLQDFIQEWASPNFHERQTWPFIVLLLGSLGFAALSSRRIDWTDLALVTGTAFLALMAGRNIALFAVVAAPVLARHAEAFLADRGWQIRPATRQSPAMIRLNWALLLVIVLGSAGKVWYAANPHTVQAAKEAILPVGAVAYINKSRPEGKMFNSYNWGGYLMYAAPDYPVYVDGRTDLYGDAFLREYLGVLFLKPEWQAVLDKREIGWILIENGSVLDSALRNEARWRLAYEDDLAVIYTRERGES